MSPDMIKKEQAEKLRVILTQNEETGAGFSKGSRFCQIYNIKLIKNLETLILYNMKKN